MTWKNPLTGHATLPIFFCTGCGTGLGKSAGAIVCLVAWDENVETQCDVWSLGAFVLEKVHHDMVKTKLS